MTTAVKRSFEEEWASLAALLRAWLLRRGFSFHHRDDIVQETGLRLFRIWDQVDPQRSIRGLTFRIANNVLWEEQRRSTSVELMDALPDLPGVNDVESRGIARMELNRVHGALRELSQSQRAVILAEVGDGRLPVRSPDAIKMLRMRARKRLNSLLERATASALAIFSQAKRGVWRWSSEPSRREISMLLEGSGATWAAVCGVVAVVIAATGMTLVPARSQPRPYGGRPPNSAGIPFDSIMKALHKSANRPSTPPSKTVSRGRHARNDGTPGYTVSVGDKGPIRGGATVHPTGAKGDGIEPPQCTAGRKGDLGVTVSCDVDTGKREYDVEATVEARP